ncbi:MULTISPECIES: STAS domain-containing protein [Magnetospirillum]|nr:MULTISPECIES: STAS domain-containing protein [Magnetospirillum]MBF0325386.1 STAS domain-containing protein [Alphaproteobacteria bacterium]CAA7624725.1 Anti-sigma-factor antagonist [Magnetospirillum sp. LM-5]
MDYAFEGRDKALTIHVSGRMTHSDYKGFRDILARINTDRPKITVFDLEKVEFVDSSALGMLLIVRDAAQQTETELVLKGASGQVAKLISISKLHKYFTLQ